MRSSSCSSFIRRQLRHAIRSEAAQKLVALGLALLLLFNNAFGIFAARPAKAAQLERVGYSKYYADSYYHLYTFVDRLGRLAFCIQRGEIYNSAATFQVRPWGANKKVVWLLRRAPKTAADLSAGQTIAGEHLTGDKLYATYQCAVWLAAPDVYVNNVPERVYTNNEEFHRLSLKPYVDALLREAEAHANDPSLKSSEIVYLLASTGQDLVARAFDVDVEVIKVSAKPELTEGNAEYGLSGAFEVINEAGIKVASFTTNAQGEASIKLNPQQNYRLRELQAPKGFMLARGMKSFFVGSSNTSVTMENEPVLVEFFGQKKDSATRGAPQHGASLAGAKYKLVDAKGKSHIAISDAAGKISFKGIALGKATITEIEAPAGYMLDTRSHDFYVGAKDAGRAVNGVIRHELKDELIERPLAFDLEIAKFKGKLDSEDVQGGMEEPAAGVRFEIISNSTNQVVGTITTNERGFADTSSNKNLWFGSGERTSDIKGALPYDKAGYTISEVESTVPAGYARVSDFVIKPEQMVDGVKLHYILNDKKLSTRLQIVKVDAESGNTVSLPNFEFSLTDEEGKLVEQELWYPNYHVLRSYKTDESGYVTLPDKLESGTYTIHELRAEAPYLLPERTSSFRVSDHAEEISAISLERVSNRQAKGIVRLHKQEAEQSFAGTVYDAGKHLEGAEFDLIAKEDIVSPDGVTHAIKGELVDHLVTDNTGFAQSKELYLGTGESHYQLIETKAPTGQVLDSTPHDVTLSYDNQEEALVYSDVSIENKSSVTIITKRKKDSDQPLVAARFELWNLEDEIYLAPSQTSAFVFRSDTKADFKIQSEEFDEVGNLIKQEKQVKLTYDDKLDAYIAKAEAGHYLVFKDNEEIGSIDLNEGNPSFASYKDKSYHQESVLLKKDAKAISISTNEAGEIDLIHLKKGSWRIRELEAPAGYLVNEQIISFDVDEQGRTEGKNVFKYLLEDDFTKVDFSKVELTGGPELAGAKLAVKNEAGETLYEWTSGTEPYRIEALPPGKYLLEEQMSPRTHELASSVVFEVAATGDIQKVEMQDEPIKISAQIDKRQEIADPTAKNFEANGDAANRAEVTQSDQGFFRYTIDLRNQSNTWTDEFTLTEELKAADAGLAELISIQTPKTTGDLDGKFNLWYQTNKPTEASDETAANATIYDLHENPWLDSEEVLQITGPDKRVVDFENWRLWQANLSCEEVHELSVSDLKLADGEKLSKLRLEFGSVSPDFTSRPDNWEREDLKDEHDDIYQLDTNYSEKHSPLILHMQVHDTYKDKAELLNYARIDVFRNGGGDSLEAHDEDQVKQVPKAIDELHKTGAGFIKLLLGTASMFFIGVSLIRLLKIVKPQKRHYHRRR